MRTPARVTFALWVTLVTFAVCLLGIREELRRAHLSSSSDQLRKTLYPMH